MEWSESGEVATFVPTMMTRGRHNPLPLPHACGMTRLVNANTWSQYMVDLYCIQVVDCIKMVDILMLNRKKLEKQIIEMVYQVNIHYFLFGCHVNPA